MTEINECGFLSVVTVETHTAWFSCLWMDEEHTFQMQLKSILLKWHNVASFKMKTISSGVDNTSTPSTLTVRGGPANRTEEPRLLLHKEPNLFHLGKPKPESFFIFLITRSEPFFQSLGSLVSNASITIHWVSVHWQSSVLFNFI